jgi:hypothetical protein
MTLPANKEIVLDGVQGKAMEIILEIDPKESSMIELDVFRSSDEAEVTRMNHLMKKLLNGLLNYTSSKSFKP